MSRGIWPGGQGRRDEIDSINAIEAVAVWCQAAQAAMQLPLALRKIADRFDADLAALTRVDHEDRSPEAQARGGQNAPYARIVAFDRRANLADDIGGFRVSYATAICGTYVAGAKLGSIWHARRADFDHILRLRAPLVQRHLIETVVIPLEHHITSSDFLELHFGYELGASMLDRLGMIAPTLSESWKVRAYGILSQNVLATRRETAGPETADTDEPILGVANSFGLSRSEYRVCLLLSRGLNNMALLDELAISLSTLRTHLRNIYAKTGTASQAELVQRLLVTAQAPRHQGGAIHVA